MPRASGWFAPLIGLAAIAGPGRAQLPSPSAAAMGMGGSYTAASRGFAAVAWNPANLALPGAGRVTLAILPAGVSSGMGPVTLSDLADWGDRTVPVDVRERWLQDIIADGGERGTAGSEITYFALSMGRVGFQVGSLVRSRSRISPDAAELLLFGNAGRGEPRDMELEDSFFDGDAVSTAALAYGHPVDLGENGRLAFGVTLKYTVGHVMASVRDRDSRVTSDPLELDLRFPVVHSDTSPTFDNGSGVGLDLGASWLRGRWTLSAGVQNLLSTFSWREEEVFFRPGEALLSADRVGTRFDAEPLGEAPDDVRDWVAEHEFGPTLRAGAAAQLSPSLMVAADVRAALGDQLTYGAGSGASVGVEGRPRRWLPLRGGLGFTSEGIHLSAGAGVELGPVRVDGALQRRSDGGGATTVGMIGLSFHRAPLP